MTRGFALRAGRTGITAEGEYISLRHMVTERKVPLAVTAILHAPGPCATDIDLSAGMVAR